MDDMMRGSPAAAGGDVSPASLPAPSLDARSASLNSPEENEAPVSITDLLMEAIEWERVCRRQPEHDICEACEQAGLLRNAAKAVEHWMRQALRYKFAADFLWNEVMERSTFGQDENAQIPDHDCGYIHRPDGGACDWHEEFVQVADYLGHVDEWAEEAMLNAE